MTVSTTSSKTVARGNGATTSFPYQFLIPDSSSLVVTFTDASGNQTILASSQYSVSGLGNALGGTVSYPLTGSPMATGTSLTIARVLPLTQTTTLLGQGGYFPQAVEGAMDRLEMQIQQVAGGAQNYPLALTFPVVDVNPTTVLPPAVARANKYLAFDASGNLLALPGTSSSPDVSANVASATGGSTARTVAAHFGDMVNVKDFGAKGDGATDDTTAIQSAINSLSSGNGNVIFPPGTYKTTNTLLVLMDRVNIVGAGRYATQILFAPTASVPCIRYSKGSRLFQFAIRDLAIYSNDSTFTKIAIDIVDASTYCIERVTIGGSITVAGTNYWSGANSIGLKISGREIADIRDLDIQADRPLVIATNPNSGISIDHHHFQNLYLTANANPCVEILSGVNLTNVTFDGYQAWVKGTYGLYWVDVSAAQASLNLAIANVRCEQGTDATAYIIRIDHNSSLQGLLLQNIYGGVDRNGYHFRRCQSVTFVEVSYTSTTAVALDADATVTGIRGVNCFWQAGSTATLAGQRLIFGVPKNPSTGALPPDFQYDLASNTTRTLVLGGSISEDLFIVNDSASVQLGTNVMQGMLVVSDSEGLSAIFCINGTAGSVSLVADPLGIFSITQGTASHTNVYFSAGNYSLENKRGAQRKYKVQLIGSYSNFS